MAIPWNIFNNLERKEKFQPAHCHIFLSLTTQLHNLLLGLQGSFQIAQLTLRLVTMELCYVDH